MCGVLAGFCLRRGAVRGSSPHVRGFVLLLYARQRLTGFIPACAGFCYCRNKGCARHQVHPRMCGVLTGRGQIYFVNKGSSPHVRGFGLERPILSILCGFIPACAGFCLHHKRFQRPPWVHPRMCGVLMSMGVVMSRSQGSSPHVRGFGAIGVTSTTRRRFIPACAGFWAWTPW